MLREKRVQTIKAHPCVFKGVLMRSKTEARWAVVFEVMKLKWEYETTIFHLSPSERFPNGVSYVPDFHLTHWIVEVKPDLPTGEEVEKLVGVLRRQEKATAFLIGSPSERNMVITCQLVDGTPEFIAISAMDFFGLNPKQYRQVLSAVNSIKFTKKNYEEVARDINNRPTRR